MENSAAGTLLEAVKAKEAAVRALCAKYQVRRLELFGSAAAGTFISDESDIDLLVEFMPGADLGPWLSRYFDLRGELETLLGHKVDLVMVSALKNPYFIREVNRTRSLLYAA